MAWDLTMRTMLRVLVNDTEDPLTYSDTRLEQILVVAAHYVKEEIDFDTTYTINIASPDITPDPTESPRDDDFTNFVILKAACLTDQSLFRTKALTAGIRAKCGPAMLETLRHMDGFAQLLDKGPCAAYEIAKWDFELSNPHTIRAILSPFTSNNFDPATLQVRER